MKPLSKVKPLAATLLLVAAFAIPAHPGDWPMWRYDARRSGASPHALADQLHLHWVRELPAPARAWTQQIDDYEKLAFDVSFEPVAAGGTLFVPSSATDSIVAYDIGTGEERWRHTTDGPVRLAPLAWGDRVYAASDGGTLYCLDAETGKAVWTFRAAPSNRKVLGNERMISMWPVRGGPVIYDGTLYLAAGLWPHEGVFIYALDAETGAVQWVNSGSASELIKDSKQYYSFGGVAPQGHLVVEGDRLIVPGGRTAPAVYDRLTGDILFYNIVTATTGRGAGGHFVFSRGEWFFNARDASLTHMYALLDGAQFGSVNVALTEPDALIGLDREGRIVAFDPELAPTGEQPPPMTYDRFGRPLPGGTLDASRRPGAPPPRLRRGVLGRHYRMRRLWQSAPFEGVRRLHAKAGQTVYGSGPGGRVFAVRLDDGDDAEPELRWTSQVEGEVFSIIAAHGRLVVVTEEGAIYAFGPEERAPARHAYAPEPVEPPRDAWAAHAEAALEGLEPGGGYGVMFGVGTGRFLEELLHRSDLQIAAFDPDPANVARMRERFLRAGLYGRRVSVHEGKATDVRLPPYIASLVATEDPLAAGLAEGAEFAKALFRPLRPYGGRAFVPLDAEGRGTLAAAIEQAGLEEDAQTVLEPGGLRLVRPGPLPGAAAWTHQYADAANTVFSPDARVRAPLGVVWFGGPNNDRLAPNRHAKFPIPQIVRGLAVALSESYISARCVYTGREVWARKLEDFHYLQPPYLYDPGACFIGSPYASAPDSVYLIHEDSCLRLDILTGEVLARFSMPSRERLEALHLASAGEEAQRSVAAELQRRGVPKEIRDEAIIRALDTYPFAYSFADPQGIAEIEPGEYYVGIVGRTGHRHRSNAGLRDYRLTVDGEDIPLRRPTPERGVFFEMENLPSRGHGAGGFEVGTVLTRDPVALSPDSALEIRRWSRSDFERIMLFRTEGDVEGISQAILASRLAAPARYTGPELRWGHVRISGDNLIAAAYPHMFDDLRPGQQQNWNLTSSEFVVAMNRVSGEVRWAHRARHGFRHNAIAASDNRVFVLDNLSSRIVERARRRGIEPHAAPEIRALDIGSGEVLWRYGLEVFGTWLAYSSAHDALLQAGRPESWGPRDEPRNRRMALRGADGSVLWDDASLSRRGPLGLHLSLGLLIPSIGEDALCILTGEPQKRPHPMTGREEPWRWLGALRCGTQNYSEHLITFRSGAGGFADIPGGVQSGNITGFRPGCTNNLVVAEGMLTALDYSRSCNCSYQHQTSLGLAPSPEAEMWTYSALPDPEPATILRTGINFAAPGSRLDADSGVLWAEHPPRVGPAPRLQADISFNGQGRWVRHHSAMIIEASGGPRWVAASGAEGEMEVRLEGLLAEQETRQTLRLHFAELDHAVAPGQRVFDVLVNGEVAIKEYDIAAKADGPFRGIIETIHLDGADQITVVLRQRDGAALPPLICGLEVLAVKGEERE